MPAGRLVAEWLKITRDDLKEWASSESSSRKLPELILNLIRETTPEGTTVDFPSGTGVSSGGWDGLVECHVAHSYVPLGRSGWEVSTDTNSSRKANDDYKNRCRKISARDRADMSYVQVICRPWTKARDFGAAKTAAGDFRDVKALNVDHLAAWLAQAPETTVWLREVMDKPVDGVEPLSSWWRGWLESTRVPLDAGVVLAGREDAAEKLRLLCGAGGMVTVGWEAPHEEIVAFVAAALTDSSTRSEPLYVQSLDAARRLLAPVGPRTAVAELTVVVASADLADRLAPVPPQCVVVPVAGSQKADVACAPVDSRKVAERLRIHGIDHDLVWDLAHLGRRSLLALRRQLAVRRELHLPGWANDMDAVLRRCLLLNRWDRTSAGDIEILERFTGTPHSRVEERLEQLGGNDPPFLRTGPVWHAVSASEAWLIAGWRLRDEELEQFADVVVDVLAEPDPLYGLDLMEHIHAEHQGVTTMRSQRLKEGLATSLAVLATAGDQVPTRTRHIVEDAVRRLLELANNDASLQQWAAIAPWLRLLAEAAPRAVLSAIRVVLAQDQPLATAMHQNKDAFGFPSSLSTHHFVSALDMLSWSPDYLGQAVMMLARLNEMDPAGGHGQSPVGILKDIMCPWMPNTAATADMRFEVLDVLSRRHPEVAWEVMPSMLPHVGGFTTDGATPRYRDWKDDRKPVTNGEYYDIVETVGEKLIATATAPGDWAALLDLCGDMLPQTRTELVKALGRVAENADETTRAAIWPTMREIVTRHREFSYAHWALPDSEIAQLESLMERLRPKSFAERHGWLFRAWAPSMPEVLPRDDWKKRGAVADQKRAEAVDEILDVGGIDAVVAFAGSVHAPMLVGEALARAASLDADEAMLGQLVQPEHAAAEAARGYFQARFENAGWGLFDALICEQAPPPTTVAELLRTSGNPRSVWERLEDLGAQVAEEYWQRFTPWDLRGADLLAPEAARRLAAAGRPDSSAKMLAGFDYLSGNPEYANAVAEALVVCTEHAHGTAVKLTPDVLATLLPVLHQHVDTIGVQRVASIEWEFLPALRYPTNTPNLHNALADNPDFFGEIAEVAAGAANQLDNVNQSDTARSRQRQWAARGLLRHWPRSPGLDTSGEINPKKLRTWVERARDRLAETGISASGDVAIGAALAAVPPDSEGNLPNSAVCDLIEEIASEDLDHGFLDAVLTSRGGVETAPWGGGDLDRELAAKFQHISDRLTSRCHDRTAAVFAELADHHNQCAIVMDHRTEERQVGLIT